MNISLSPSTAIALASAAFAGGSLWYARISGIAAKRSAIQAERSAKSAERQLEIEYREHVNASKPNVVMVIESVQHRWARRGFNMDDESIGFAAPFLVQRGSEKRKVRINDHVSVDEAHHRDNCAELIIGGTLCNVSDQQQLISVMPHAKRWMPRENRGLFLTGGSNETHFILDPGESCEFQWYDRHTIEEWIKYDRIWKNHFKDPEQPKIKFLEEARKWWRAKDSYQDPEDELREWFTGFQFSVVCEGRGTQRLITVWDVRPSRSAVQPADGGMVCLEICLERLMMTLLSIASA